MGKKIEKLVKESLKNITPYVPGKPIEELKRELKLKKIIKLASNENPLGASKKAVKVIKEKAKEIFRYPDSSGFYLKKALSEHLNVFPENIILGNGSSEVISMFIRAFTNPGDEIILPYPSFLIYRILSYENMVNPVEVPLDEDFSYNLEKMKKFITPRTKIIILCNPNNPTGTYINKYQLEKFLKEIPEDILVLSDEAYFEYVEEEDFGSCFPYIKKKNLIVTRTFSKIYGLAGLRIGYGIARKEIIEVLEKIRPPFNTTTLAQEAALAALQDQEHVKFSFINNSREKKYLFNQLGKLGIQCYPTQTNFILCRLKTKATPIIKKLEKNGIIIRGVKPFGLGDKFFRITIGKREENRYLIKNLKIFLK
ncbi:MAG TPA: histidinol-phosphate transaminase [Firmicutes bacterium]|nr:histidinol-phosphate transaminase [Bacillota bacterium]